jgi:hypothetical protein
MCVCVRKKNIPSVQVKNKPCVGESKNAIILGSMVYMVANNFRTIYDGKGGDIEEKFESRKSNKRKE